jgi:hypothetical protein
VAVRARRVAAVPSLVADRLRAEADRRIDRPEALALVSLMVVPAVINAILLLPELTIPVASLNDDVYHFLFIQNAAGALDRGDNLVDHWLPQIETGVAQFLYYQHLGSLIVVALQRLSGGVLDLFTTFNAVRYVLLVGLPVSVFVSGRWMGLSKPASAIAATASSLLSANYLFGFEFNSYLWRGLGLFTQLVAMHLSFLAIGAGFQAIQSGRRVWLAAILLGLLVLTHLLYGYIVGMGLLILAVLGINRSNARGRLVRLVAVAVGGAAISAYQWLPFIATTAYANATPYLQPYKYDSFGAPQVLSWLATGELFDHGRLPVLTALLAVGACVALASRKRGALAAMGLLLVWLVAFFGRPTLGPLTNLFPLDDGLLFHRFMGGVHLAAIFLIGLGGALIWGLWRPGASAPGLIGGALVLHLILAPAYVERADFYVANRSLMKTAYDAVQSDHDGQAILDTLRSLPSARVFAGLPATYGASPAMRYGDLRFYNLLTFGGFDGFAPPNQSLSLNADFIWDFREAELEDYELYNARYMVAPTGMAVAPFLSPIQRTDRYTLYQAPTSGYAQFVAIGSRIAVPTQRALFESNLAWERRHVSGTPRSFIRYDYPASNLGPGPSASPGCPDGGHIDYELFRPGKLDLVVRCTAPAALILKMTYHPNWTVTVDGLPAPTFMVSPSYIGIEMPAGVHQVNAVYEATAFKTPLLTLGGIVLLGGLIFRRRLDGLMARLAP